MVHTFALKKLSFNIKTILMDIIFITAIYFTPAFSHLLSLPLYLIEPMRIILILSMVHTNKLNSYFLAITLPLFSFFFSGHPVFPKVILVMIELLVNIGLFFMILKLLNNSLTDNLKEKGLSNFLAMLVSIILSKSVYYFLKFLIINGMLMNSDLISTPVYIQIILALILSFYIWFSYYRQKSLTKKIEIDD